jgi:minimal PKS chain-length factor (CLF/KS beta)
MTDAVITGLGIVAPSGIGTPEHWAATVGAQQCVRRIDRFDPSRYATQLAGQVPDFSLESFVDDRIAIQTDRWSWFSLAATQLALEDGSYDPSSYDSRATGVVLASGSGGNEFGQREIARLWSRGRTAVSAYQSIAWFYAASTGQVSIRHQTKGPSGVLVSEGAGGLDSLAQARRVIRRGTSAVLSGGTEAGISPYALTCQMTSGRLSTAIEPELGYRPFDKAANGHTPGEGGAVLLVEDEERAVARRAPEIYGVLAGYGSTHDAHHYQDPAPDPRYYAMAMRHALADAGLTPDDVDVVFADGAGSPDLDALEIGALQDVFGQRRTSIPVTAPQGLIGRLCAGGSALNVANALLSMRHGVVPGVGNLRDPVPARGLDLLGAATEMSVRVAMVNARGYGGFNSSLILRAYQG